MSSRIITDGYDEFEIRKMSKTGIMLFFKNQIQLKEKEIQLKEKLIEIQIQLKEKGVELKDLKYTDIPCLIRSI